MKQRQVKSLMRLRTISGLANGSYWEFENSTYEESCGAVVDPASVWLTMFELSGADEPAPATTGSQLNGMGRPLGTGNG